MKKLLLSAFTFYFGFLTLAFALDNKLYGRSLVYVRDMASTLAHCLPLKTEQQPSFHGCGGWHEAVAATWGLMVFSHITGDSRYDPLIESRLTKPRLQRELLRLQQFPGADTIEARGWLLRLYILDRVVNNSERMRSLVTINALQMRSRFNKNLERNMVDLEPHGLAALFLQEYGLFIGDPSLLGTISSVVEFGQQLCSERGVCAGVRSYLWWEGASIGDTEPFLLEAITSERYNLLQLSMDKTIYMAKLKTSLVVWLERHRSDPMVNVYGIWAFLPILTHSWGNGETVD